MEAAAQRANSVGLSRSFVQVQPVAEQVPSRRPMAWQVPWHTDKPMSQRLGSRDRKSSRDIFSSEHLRKGDQNVEKQSVFTLLITYNSPVSEGNLFKMGIKNFPHLNRKWICRHSVTLWTINLHPIGTKKKFPFGQKIMSQIFCGGQGLVGQRPRTKKNIDFSSYLSHLKRYWSENENLSLKKKKKT